MNAQAREYFEAAGPRLRAMQEHDIDRVLEIEREAYDFPWTPGIFRDCLRGGYGCWVVEQAGVVIGYGILNVAAGEAHILNVCISPQAQGEGHGRHLVRRLIDLSRWQRAERVFLEVRPSNPRAIALYHSLGFNEIGRRPRYYPAHGGREDAIVMAQELLDGD
ncbi:ribosomal protein S18-alanine N-acetyltransferase [Pseudomarimonas salicorniae]|uniref:[Ribosomal protein bS18]-alanine N-acetyltransferase n=1 Tax=Pseudomarimonas salicorniae TaxID=2933270 RepID=A0ABT0GGH0_9GAMM|nr:ribosomal protein S18-alanine N-acetyltransferase [Lysobacter sp. CAU 1642]MCK7593631.1 ribosomal protein S18-alanine N-acetyltransferase [Lysobacter sp. CAU 1642]